MQKVLPGIILAALLSGCVVYVPHNEHQGVPPGHGGTPPGHGGIPPGQAKKMGPPPVRVVGIPSFVLLPGTMVMVMENSAAAVFFVNGFYYYAHGDSWWVATHQEGPWRTISSRRLPEGLKGRSALRLRAEALAMKRHGTPPGHRGTPHERGKNSGPPPVQVAGAPSFVLVPGTKVMVMADSDSVVFYLNGFYYYSHRNSWWVAKHYEGPWRAIASHSLPAGLRGKSPTKLRAEALGKERRGRRS